MSIFKKITVLITDVSPFIYKHIESQKSSDIRMPKDDNDVPLWKSPQEPRQIFNAHYAMHRSSASYEVIAAFCIKLLSLLSFPMEYQLNGGNAYTFTTEYVLSQAMTIICHGRNVVENIWFPRNHYHTIWLLHRIQCNSCRIKWIIRENIESLPEGWPHVIRAIESGKFCHRTFSCKHFRHEDCS